MAEGDQVTQIGDQDQKSLGWRSALPDEYKEHEWVKTHQKPGDFVKSAIEIKTDRDALKAKLDNSIPRLTDKSTDTDKVAHRKATGVPDKPEDYEFPKPEAEGMENSPEMVKWAQGVFFKLGIPKEPAKELGKEWNAFVAGMVEAENKHADKERTESEKKFRSNFKSEDDFKGGYELTKRFWNKVTGTSFDDVYKEAEAWQVPLFMDFIFKVAGMTGEDRSPPGRSTGEKLTEGMVYDKSPAPPKT